VILNYRYRLLPTRAQHRALDAILESQRQLYNAALEERMDAFRKTGIRLSYFDQTKSLTELRREDADSCGVPVNLQRATLHRVETAYRAFFRRVAAQQKGGFPRFRGKGRFHSFGFRRFSGITLIDRRLRFKGMPGGLRVHLHRPLPSSAIRSCTLRRYGSEWMVSFAIEVLAMPPQDSGQAIGLDLGLKTFAMLSDGIAIPSLRAARRAERRLRNASRAHRRTLPGSAGRAKALLALQRCHATVARRRDTFLHQTSAMLVGKFQVIAVEALPIAGLASSRLSKDVRDAAWGRFISFLRYKAEKAGARLVEVDPVDTSQLCSCCGARVAKTLRERMHACETCGLTIDRDLNAARNILNRAVVGPGLHNVAGCGKRAGGNLNS
jgi:putative transposase